MTKSQEKVIEEFKNKNGKILNTLELEDGKIVMSYKFDDRCYTSTFIIGKRGAVKSKTIY